MSVLCEHATAAYFAYCRIFQQSAHITYLFLHKLVFLTAILILFVFPLRLSIRFRHLYHLVANRMLPLMCPDTCGTRWGSWFLSNSLPYFRIFLPHFWCLCGAHIFLKCRIKLTVSRTSILLSKPSNVIFRHSSSPHTSTLSAFEVSGKAH